jgi:hypothetical protein
VAVGWATGVGTGAGPAQAIKTATSPTAIDALRMILAN